MNMLFMMLMLPLMISILLMMLCYMISKKMIMDREKMSPFECGFDPKSSARMPFSLQFFLIAVLFLIFDVEIAIILPMIITLKYSILHNWIITMNMFLLTLIMGLYHEWNNGVLEWAK
uniref:NADH-ubiquinone oxidoreductase chain 3 n=1 Tax=Gorpis annulatus TaxID=696245 RepID=K7NBN3_9HEMI|nr:NADH dehydrogenase subunit 3 [Gorpis annulatus]AEI53348.1 NADH dehydrogenase subunit 3 [Gorpis annulatus]